jgi:predicted nucleotidyltransferase
VRLNPSHADLIVRTARQLLGPAVQVTLFGSRVQDHLRGGDVDLLVEVAHAVDTPAVLSARLASRLSRAMDGRKVDVVLKAPNLQAQAIHHIAKQTGVVLCG